ncbi:hypothetical protein Tco_0163955 [Tanacetum coccineum]
MGRNLEVYVDDMVIKSKIELEMIKDVEETLLTLKKVNMKLMPKKCSFGMEEGKFLGYIVTFEGIRANSEKKVVVNMPSPNNLKQMQRLSGKLAALNRFLSKAAERALPCLDTLKKSPKKEEELMVYLSAANEVVSAILLTVKKILLMPYNQGYHGQANKSNIEQSGGNEKIGQNTMIEDNPTQAKTDRPDETLADGESMEEQEDTKTKAPGNIRAEADIWKLYTDGASNNHSHIPKEENKKADALSKLAAVQCEGLTKRVLIEELNERPVDIIEVNAIIEEATRTWMTPIQENIEKRILPKDATEPGTSESGEWTLLDPFSKLQERTTFESIKHTNASYGSLPLDEIVSINRGERKKHTNSPVERRKHKVFPLPRMLSDE